MASAEQASGHVERSEPRRVPTPDTRAWPHGRTTRLEGPTATRTGVSRNPRARTQRHCSMRNPVSLVPLTEAPLDLDL
jgi:hypothetical protein